MSLLTGIKVIDLTCATAGLLLTQMLADQGVEMVRVETPDDSARDHPGAIVHLRGRKSIVIDRGVAGGGAVLRRLIDGCDVLVTEPALGGREPLAETYDELAQGNPRLIWCRLTAYGHEVVEAPDWAHDHLVAARYGAYDQPAWRRPGPSYLTAPVPSLGAAYLGVQAIGTALYQREKTGLGQEVSTSLVAGALAFQPNYVRTTHDAPPATNAALIPRRAAGAAPFYSIYECADGNFVQLGCLSRAFIDKGMDAMGLREAMATFGFDGSDRAGPVDTHDEIMATVAARFHEKTYAEWSAIFEAHDVPYGICRWSEDVLDDPQVRHEGLVATVSHPTLGPVEQIGPSVLFSDAPWAPPAPPPLPGADTSAILASLGFDSAAIADLRRVGAVR